MPEINERILRQSYSEIIHGFSIAVYNNSKIFIRHFSSLDNLEIDFLFHEYFKEVVAKGYPTEADRLSHLKKDNLWGDGDENNIELLKSAISNMSLTKAKAFLRRDVDSINQQIQEQEKILFDMLTKRETLIGATAEKATKRHKDTRLIFKSLFFDIGFTKKLYTELEFEELDTSEISNLFFLYNTVMENFSELSIKKIALSPFFQNAFYLTESVYEFYGKPVCFLTNFQVQLMAYGNFYKSILSKEMKPPENLLHDPQKLEDWYSGKSNADQLLEKAGGGDNDNISIFGATQEDLKNWGYDQQGVSLQKATQDAGGEMNLEELMKLHGVS